MSDLQDALAWAKSGYEVPYQVGKHIIVLAEAARRVANPDIEAARQWSEDNGFLWDEYAFTMELQAALGSHSMRKK